MGGGVDITTLPKELSNQLLYTSSASSVDSYYYSKYKEYAKAMFLGSKQHFVADINCEIVMNATYRGKIYPASLLSQEKIDTAMKENKEKALREYYNQFTTDGGKDAVVKRAQIAKNAVVQPPILYNDTNNKKFVLAYDPARSLDNSVVGIAELYRDEEIGWKARVCNMVNFMDVGKKNKTPMRTPEQILHLKKLILDYNGQQLDYDNIHEILIDAGSGGAGVNIADYLMDDWYEYGHEGQEKYKHRGLIDKEYSADYIRKFPNAIDKIKLLQPAAYKSVIYEALSEMVSQDLIEFTAEYDNKGYLTLIEVNEAKRKKAIADYDEKVKDKHLSKSEYNEGLEEYLDSIDFASTKVYHLSPDEEVALTQLDNMKEEVVNMVRIKREGNKDSFSLTKEKENKMHDDRAYVLALIAYSLQELRRKDTVNRPKEKKKDIVSKLPIKQGKRYKMLG